MQILRRLGYTLFVGLFLAQVAHAAPFSQAVIFGDSLSDMGNAYNQLGTLAMDNPEDYYNGRFSNGPVWVEYLATELQLPTPAANTINTATGRDYAFGAPWTHAGFFEVTHWVINDIDEQVNDYLDNDGGPVGDELFVLLGGANDLFDGETNTSIPVNNLNDDITDLYNAGARHFLVANLPLLGQTPRYKGTASESVFDARSIQFNAQLATSLDNLEVSLPDVTFFRIDTAAMIADAIDNPATYGLVNVTNQALGLTGIDPDTYLFWDTIHPTTKGHELLAQNAASVLFSALSTLPGDPNFDGFVGLDDLDIILNNWNTNVTPGNPLFGDLTNDGYVGLGDLDIVLNNWNAGTPPTVSVPEPTSIVFVAFLAVIATRQH